MIIEIKDLPTDRNIKNVSFNIEFEDGEIRDISKLEQTFGIPPYPNVPEQPKAPNVEKEEPTIPKSVETSKRPENVAFDMDMEL